MLRYVLASGGEGPTGWRLERDAPVPDPGPGEIRMRVGAVALNYRDLFVLDGVPGWAPQSELVPLADAAGEIDAVGAGVDDWRVGEQAVTLYFRGWADGLPPPDLGTGAGAGNEPGVLAEYIVLPASHIARAPVGLSHAEAATLPCAGVTAWTAVFGGKDVGPGTRILTVGTGGVSIFALLLARAAGADVYGVSGDAAKLGRLVEIGAVAAIDRRATPEWGTEAFTRFGGVDKVVDPIGEINRSMAALRPGGEVAVMGLMAQDGPPHPLLLMARTLSIRGTVVGSTADYERLRRFVDAHGIRPVIGARFGFGDLAAAYAAQRNGVFGKVVVDLAI